MIYSTEINEGRTSRNPVYPKDLVNKHSMDTAAADAAALVHSYSVVTCTSGDGAVTANTSNSTLALTSADSSVVIAGTDATNTVDLAVDDTKIDHGNLGGLHDDDHAQYILQDGTRAFTDYIDIAEHAAPGTPAADTLRIYNEDYHGFSFLYQKDDGGMIRRFVRDSVFVVRNDSGVQIVIGTPVYATGSVGNVPTVNFADAHVSAKMPAIGITIENIDNKAYGRVMQVGLLENFDTQSAGWSEGDVLYVASGGGLTNGIPLYPDIRQEMGTVLVQGMGNGAMQVLAKSMLQESLLDHSGLSNLNSANYTHLTAANATDLTDAGETSLHTHDHGALNGLADDDHTQYTQKATLTEQGDLYYASAASTPAALAHGTAGQYLKTGGHGANPSWAIVGALGSANTYIGDTAASYAAGTTDNTLVGYHAGHALSGGDWNVAIGSSAMPTLTSGQGNVVVGWTCGNALTTGINNVAIGTQTFYSSTDGINNVAIGNNALYRSTSDDLNTAVGAFALNACNGGAGNSSFGAITLQNVTTGDCNTCCGEESGVNLTTGSYNTIIGRGADVNAAAASYRTVIGAGASGTVDNSVTLGRTTDSLFLPGQSRVRAKRATSLSIPNATDTTMIFTAEDFDNRSEYNTGTGVFTAAVDGYYQVHAAVMFDNYAWAAGNISALVLYKDGAMYSEIARTTIQANTTFYNLLQGSDFLYMAAGATIDIRVYQNIGAAKNTYANNQFNYFSVYRVA